jgi:AcrR family transcriptional regulator
MATLTSTPARKQRSDGARSRETILRAAAQLATVEGIDGLSIGRLADHIGMSKSGLFAHFGSKEELQLATVEKAQEVYAAEVTGPALAEPDGLQRLEALCERFLSHVEREVFPGGCFFASLAAELDTRPGPVRDRITAALAGWTEMIEDSITAARDAGELAADTDPHQLTFELDALLAAANGSWLLFRDPAVFDMARTAVADRIDRARST